MVHVCAFMLRFDNFIRLKTNTILDVWKRLVVLDKSLYLLVVTSVGFVLCVCVCVLGVTMQARGPFFRGWAL